MAEETKRAVRTVTVHVETADKLRTIADRRDKTIAEILDIYAGKAIQREYARVVEERYAELGEAGA